MRFSAEFEKILAYAREEAMRTGSYVIGADHLFLGILRHAGNDAVRLLEKNGFNPAECKRQVEKTVFHEHSIPYREEAMVHMGRAAGNIVNLAVAEAAKEGSEETLAIHLLKAICRQADSTSARILKDLQIKRPGGESPAEAPSVSTEEMLGILSAFPVSGDIPS